MNMLYDPIGIGSSSIKKAIYNPKLSQESIISFCSITLSSLQQFESDSYKYLILAPWLCVYLKLSFSAKTRFPKAV